VVSPELSAGALPGLPRGGGLVDIQKVRQSACLGSSPSPLVAVILDRVARFAASGESDLSAGELDDLSSLLSVASSSAPLVEEIQQLLVDEISPALRSSAALLRGNSISPLQPLSSSVSVGYGVPLPLASPAFPLLSESLSSSVTSSLWPMMLLLLSLLCLCLVDQRWSLSCALLASRGCRRQ
jgi:hypothetical protein